MKTFKYIASIIALLLVFSSCEKDGEMIYLSSPKGGELTASDNNVLLSKNLNQTIVLSLAWTRSQLQVSYANVSAPNVMTTVLQASLSKDFSTTIIESTESSQSKAYSGFVLNTLAKNLGAEPGKLVPVYFRLKVSVGNNIDPVYSNIATVNITPYLIDMTVGALLTSSKDATNMSLYSSSSNGIYSGFVGVSSWYNYYLEEGDGTIWGNVGQDNTAFYLSSDDSKWNFWYPGQTGCYYTVVNTIDKVWSALYIPSLTISGDISGSMIYEKAQNEWIYVFNASAAGAATIKISGTGSLYDYSTGTDDSKAISKSVSFGMNASNVTFGETASNMVVNIPAQGVCTLVLNLNNPKQWTCSVVQGDATPVSVSKYVYVSGLDDGISGSWTFDNYLILYNEENLAYEGVVNADSKWGYKFYTVKDDWNSVLGTESGAATGGILSATGGSIPAPIAGLYLIDVDLKNKTYALTSITSVSYAGFNDDWSISQMSASSTPGVYTATVNITKASSSGAQILINGDWNIEYGGSNGMLKYKASGNNITDDAALTPGSYTLSVNLNKGTYSFTK